MRPLVSPKREGEFFRSRSFHFSIYRFGKDLLPCILSLLLNFFFLFFLSCPHTTYIDFLLPFYIPSSDVRNVCDKEDVPYRREEEVDNMRISTKFWVKFKVVEILLNVLEGVGGMCQ